MRARRKLAGRLSLLLLIVLTLIVATSLYAGLSGSGRQGQAAGGSIVQAIVNGKSFVHVLSNGELAQDARDALVAEINTDTRYNASASTPPGGVFEPDDVILEVLTGSNAEVASLFACETDGTYENSGAHIASGRLEALFLGPTAVAGGGSFNLRLELSSGQEVDVTVNTTPGNVAGLIAALTVALQGEGLTVTPDAPYFVVTKPGDRFVSNRVSTTDSLIKHTCAGLRNQAATPPPPGAAVPFLQPSGVVFLVCGLLLTGILMILRKARA